MILENLDKNNLHHAYLIEGLRDEIVPEIIEFAKKIGVKTSGNPDFCQISLDSFKIEDARNLKSLGAEKSFSGKKIFIISANSFLLEAQNTLLKIFEEPIENTIFFLIVPDVDALLRTLVSRFYLIKSETKLVEELKMAEKFILLSLPQRIQFIKEIIALPEEDEEETENIILDSARSKSVKFLNALELTLHQKLMSKNILEAKVDFFDHLFKVREYLRQPGSSVKNLMESVTLVIPKI
jgi:DNA polymerase III delta prime subunit